MKITLEELEILIKNNHLPYINSPSGMVKITDSYRKYGEGLHFEFDDGYELKTSINHIFWYNNMWVKANNIDVGYQLGDKKVQKISYLDPQEWIDFSVNADHESYYLNGILHHNSGKSGVIGLLYQWHKQYNRKMLLIVPTIQLVSQMKSDIMEYFGDKEGDLIHCVSGGIEKETELPLTITTFQSYMKDKVDPEYLKKFDVVIGDEAWQFKAKEIKSLMEKIPNAEYRIGLTGSTDGSVATMVTLEGLFGNKYKTISTRELIDRGLISDIKIKCITLKYPEEIRKALHNKKDSSGKKISFKYENEIDYLISSELRNNFIIKLLSKIKGNSLVLFNRVDDHGEVLYNLLKESLPKDRNVYFVSGKIKSTEREYIRKQIENEENAIIVASKVFVAGTDMRKLHNLITVNPTKSQNNVLQSIGRVLRKSKSKTHATLYDISDDLSWKRSINHTLKHFFERVKLYSADEFEYKLHTVEL